MRYGCFWLCVVLGSVPAGAQSVISAHSGTIHYIEGDVTIDGNGLHPKFAEFPEVKSGQVLATDEGRAEVLLTPGVFLRLAEKSSVRMLSNALADTRIAVIFGSVLIDWEPADPVVRLQVREESGQVVLQQRLTLSQLRAKAGP